jgi:hypothetical protein
MLFLQYPDAIYCDYRHYQGFFFEMSGHFTKRKRLVAYEEHPHC